MLTLFAALVLAQNLAIEGGEYFAGDSMQPNRCIRISGEIIQSIGRDRLPEDKVIDAHGKWIVPGLIDSHAHATFVPDEAGIDPTTLFPLYLKAGVTTLRDLGGDPVRTVAVARRNPNGPTIFAGSWFFESYGTTHAGPWSRLVRTDEEIEEAVADAKAKGVVTVKIYGQLHPVLAQRLATAAKKAGLGTACHPAFYSAVPLATDSIEHASSVLDGCLPPGKSFTFANAAAIDLNSLEVRVAIETMRRNGTALCPTLLAIGPGWRLMDNEALREHPDNRIIPKGLQRHWERTRTNGNLQPGERVFREAYWKRCQALTLAVHQAGVPLIVGSDAPWAFLPPGLSMHREMELLVSIGIPPAEVLKGATINGAKVLRQNRLGAIGAERIADLLILDGNPLADIRNTRKIVAVIHRGRLHTPTP
jgi:hypothetical protein